MSVEAMAQVWKLDLPREQKLVLMAFADHANDTGFAYPSIARIAWKCGYTQKRSVAAIVRKLIDEEGVLEVVDKAHGRTPTQYRIRWDRGKQLPEFDPLSFKSDGDRGAEIAPQGSDGQMSNSDHSNSLMDQGENDTRGAENAPHPVGVQKTHPYDSVGVQSATRRGAISARRGAVATAPEPLTINQRRACARASESRAPASSEEREQREREFEIRKLNGLAKKIGAELVTPNEPLDHAKQRIEGGHSRWLADQADALAARRRESAALAEAPA